MVHLRITVDYPAVICYIKQRPGIGKLENQRPDFACASHIWLKPKDSRD